MPEESKTPSFRAIAELFEIPILPEEESEEAESLPKQCRNADESDALGRAYLGEGDYERAIEHFKRACEQRSPGDIRSQVDLAGALEYSDQAPQALRQYERALEASKDAIEPQLGASAILKRYGRFSESIERLQEAIRAAPDDSYLRIKLAETLAEAGHPKAALASAQAAIAAKPDEPYYHSWLGDHLIAMREYEMALDSLRAAIELSPGDDYLYLRSAVAFWRCERFEDAIKAVRLAGDLDPNLALVHGLLQKMLLAMGRVDESVQEQASARKMDDYDRDKLDRMADEMGLGGV